jgi:hypothetical protein
MDVADRGQHPVRRTIASAELAAFEHARPRDHDRVHRAFGELAAAEYVPSA